MSDIQPYEAVPDPLISQPDFKVPSDMDAAFDELVSHYPKKRSATLMLLHAIQERHGFISREATEWVARKLELQPINVLEVVTFYPMFKHRPVGKWHLKICRTLSCALAGSRKLHAGFCARFGLDPLAGGAQTTKDGRISVEFVECLASCGTAPVLMCNETLHENVSESMAAGILAGRE